MSDNRPKNTIKVSDGRDIVNAPPGRQLLGLIKVKNITIEDDWGKKDGLRYVFLAKGNGGMCCVDVNAASSKNSFNYKLISSMLGGKMPENAHKDEKVMYDAMCSCIDGWYDGMIEHIEWRPKNEPSKVVILCELGNNKTVMPAEAHYATSLGKASEYFKKEQDKRDVSGQSPSVPAGQTGFEDYADAGKAAAEDYSDITKYAPDGLGRFMYAIDFAKDKATEERQLAFLTSVKAKYNNNTGFFHTPEEVKQLEKKFKGLYDPPPKAGEIGTPSFDEDDLPF